MDFRRWWLVVVLLLAAAWHYSSSISRQPARRDPPTRLLCNTQYACWSSDGKSLYYYEELSDRLYLWRYEFATKRKTGCGFFVRWEYEPCKCLDGPHQGFISPDGRYALLMGKDAKLSIQDLRSHVIRPIYSYKDTSPVASWRTNRAVAVADDCYTPVVVVDIAGKRQGSIRDASTLPFRPNGSCSMRRVLDADMKHCRYLARNPATGKSTLVLRLGVSQMPSGEYVDCPAVDFLYVSTKQVIYRQERPRENRQEFGPVKTLDLRTAEAHVLDWCPQERYVDISPALDRFYFINYGPESSVQLGEIPPGAAKVIQAIERS